MKTILSILVVSVAAIVATPSFAQSISQAPSNPGSVESSPDGTQQGAITWQPDGQSSGGKTRAQVYQELIHAQQDGQIAYLNRTLYAHH